MEKLKDKRVFIAGASGTIGMQVAKLLVGGGAKVYISGRNSDKLHTAIEFCGIPANQAYVMDISKEEEIKETTNKVLESGPIDILINATGIGIIKPFENLTVNELQQSLQVNLVGPFSLIQAFLPGMKELKKGLIINLPGILGKTPMAGAVAYSASKYGLNGMMKSLREELKRTEIRITQLFIGGVDSAFWDTIDLRVQRDKMIVAEEAAKAIWFLCQQPSSGVVSEMVIQPFNHQVI
jgi:short-subunit dehydrogenase